MQTYSGRKFWPLSPHPEDFDLEDIAHSLSMTCRYNGHCIEFYSVAEHSCHIYDKAAKDDRRWALLHDAPESYISDIVSPLKKDLPNFIEIENRIMDAICLRWNLDPKMPVAINDLDKRIVRDEMINMDSIILSEWHHIPEMGIGAQIQCWDPGKAKNEFRRRCAIEGLI